MSWRIGLLTLFVVCQEGLASAPPPRAADCFGDPLPPGAVTRFGTVRWRWASEVRGLSALPGGKLLVSCGRGAVHFWDVATGRRVRTITGFNVFDMHPASKIRKQQFITVKESSIPIYGPMTGIQNRWKFSLSLRDVDSGKEQQASEKVDGWASHVRLRPDGKQVAFVWGYLTGSHICLWDVTEAKPDRMFRCESVTSVKQLAYSRDGKYVTALLGGKTKEVRRWSVRRWRLDSLVKLGSPDVASLSPDGSKAATFTYPNKLSQFDVESETKLSVNDKKNTEIELSFSDDSKKLMVLERQKQRVDLWTVGKWEFIDTLRLPGIMDDEKENQPLQLINGRTLLTSALSSGIQRWDARTGKPLGRADNPFVSPHGVRFSADGKRLHSYDWHALYCWEAATGKLLGRKQRSPLLLGDPPNDILFSPKGRFAVEVLKRGSILHETVSGKLRRLDVKGEHIDAKAFSPDGLKMATAGKSRIAQIWDTSSGKLLRRIDASKQGKSINWLCFTHDNTRLLVGEGWHLVSVWNVATGKHLDTLRAPRSRWPADPIFGPWQTTVSPGGRYLLVTASEQLWMWDLLRRQEIGPIQGVDRDRTFTLLGPASFSQDERFLVWFDATAVPLLYEIASGGIISKLDFKAPFAFAPSGWRIAAPGSDGSTLLLDLPRILRSQPLLAGTCESNETLWKLLTNKNAALAQRALWRLATRESVEHFLARRLSPVQALPDRRVDILFRDLLCDDYSRRVHAEASLTQAGDAIRPALVAALKTEEDLEYILRLRRVLRNLERDQHLRLRETRAVLLLEARNTPEAKALLRRLASGLPGARLTQEVQAALARTK